LYNTNLNEDIEKSLIEKLKLVYFKSYFNIFRCGHNYTLKLEGMLSDILQSKDSQHEFEQYKTEEENKTKIPLLPINQFSMSVLQGSNWPFFQEIKPIIPYEIKQCIVSYEAYYKQKFPHKTLSWPYMVGTIHLLYNKGKGNEIVCTTLQGFTLLFFNNAETMAFSEICGMLGLDIDKAKRLIESLINGQILKKSGEPSSFSESDKIMLSTEFQPTVRRIALPVPREPEEEQKVKVNTDRGIAVEAAIAKVMKTRKVLSHSDLVNELVNVLPTFVPDAKMIKEKIEELISKDIILRDEHDLKLYKYVAN